MAKADIFHFFYTHVAKPVFFRFDPEDVHDTISFFGRIMGRSELGRRATSWLFDYRHPSLEQDILGMHFNNPVGLSAGFDKNARLTDVLPLVGFGFMEVGSITGEICKGNPRPRLWRMIKEKSIQVYYGLVNDGSEAISARLKHKKTIIPLGTNIAKTNSRETVDITQGIQDYAKAFQNLSEIGDYFTINLSCPNTYGGMPFLIPQNIDMLLTALDSIPTKKPIFLKLSPDLSEKELDQIIAIAKKHRVHGFISTNLTKDMKISKKLYAPGQGGLSGKAVSDLSDRQITYLYKKTKGRYVIIGVGGIFSAEDAYRKIKLGASLIELITGMIFEGPQLIGQINEGLVKLLQQDGYKNISEAVGKGWE